MDALLLNGPHVIQHDGRGWEVMTGAMTSRTDHGTLAGTIFVGADRVLFRFTHLDLPEGRTCRICGTAEESSVPSELHPGYQHLAIERLQVHLAPCAPSLN